MISIRLARFGRKKAPFYRIVAVDSTKRPTGKVLENLGFYNPAKKTKEINKEEIQNWLKKGAQLTPSVKKLLE